jgi:hypothetical protein
MNNWWGKLASDGYRDEDGSDEGSEYADSEELLGLYGSGDETTSQRWTRYCESTHDIRIPIMLEKALLFIHKYVFKRALKWHAMQNQFDFIFKHNDNVRVSAVCKEVGCQWRILASLEAKKESIQIKTFKPELECGS